MKQITLYPTAKVNLGLYVFEKRADGFHNIESIFYPVGPENSNLIPDKLTVSIFDSAEEKQCLLNNTDDNSKTVGVKGKVRMTETGLQFPGRPEDNICVKAYELLDADFHLPPAEISLEKHLPTGAGLGGGSSDGVCTLKALNELCRLNLSGNQLISYAEKLGSDCPFFMYNQPVLVTGRGEVIKPLPNSIDSLKDIRQNYRIQIAFSPDCFVSTKTAYSIVQKRPHNNSSSNATSAKQYVPLEQLITNPVEMWQDLIVNDFEPPVFQLYPQLCQVRDSLKKLGATYVRMTGSGSAIFALFRK